MKPNRVFGSIIATLILTVSVVTAQTGAPGEEAYPSNGVNQPVPPTLTLPAGTIVTVRTTQPLSSDRNRAGESFTTVLDQPVVAQGWVVARRGQTVMGRVVSAQKAGGGNASSQLAIELSDLNLVDGQPVPIRTELAEIAGGNPSRARYEGAAVGATTGTGAVIGAIAGGGTGAAIGAAVGAAAGIAGVLTTRGRATEIYPEAQLTFRLQAPVTISTEQSRQAFLPVTQSDYNRGPVASSYPPPPPRYYYPYDYYPYDYFTFYGYYGPRYYLGPSLYIGPGYYRRYR